MDGNGVEKKLGSVTGARVTAEGIRGKRVMLVGLGRVGTALFEQLLDGDVNVFPVIRRHGLYDRFSRKIAEHDSWPEFVPVSDAVCITIPTEKNGANALPYMRAFLAAGKPVITAEKAALASHPSLIKNPLVYATATVGGGTAMLRHIAEYAEPKKEVKGVLNGTFNFLSTAEGTLEERITAANQAGYTETETDDFEVIYADEKRDVIRKAVILANKSGMCKYTVREEDIFFVPPRKEELKSRRCIVRITERAGKTSVEAGFIESGDSAWLPDGVNNTLYINGERKTEGPGAGPAATARVMVEDLKTAFSK